MANAGCINAYDCNGCLIQTLQNLDSACIGVGVQYTAPNPLDDKRLDYIKYTDKCGCVQCLSAENEILIYATNGVIKNLTLTNDDVNEAIKIKWNDIFGSNRAKTIVRYKTGSYPVSITDGTLAVEETTKNQYSSTPFSLSGVLDETTYYISAFAVDSNDTIIDVQGMTITTDFFVPGYQQLNWIQSSGTQRINTGINVSNDTTYGFKICVSEVTTQYGAKSLMDMGGTGTDNYRYGISYGGLLDNWQFGNTGGSGGWGTTVSGYGPNIRGTETHVLEYNPNGNRTGVIDGTTVVSNMAMSNRSYSSNWNVFCQVYGTTFTRYGEYKLRYLKIYHGSTLVRDFVPAKRKSDNVVGLIDMLSKTFYTNSGTGTFNYG